MVDIESTTNTRESILDATDRLMARFGFRKMSMDDLAKEAGVSKRTIYCYFSSKQDVGLSSIGRVVDQVHASLQEIANGPGSCKDRLRRMLMERVMGRVCQVSDYHQSLDELFEVVRPAYMARRKAFFEKEIGIFAALLSEGKNEERFAIVTDPVQDAQNLILATNAFLPYSLSVEELGMPERIKCQLITMVDMLLRGLSTPPIHHEETIND